MILNKYISHNNHIIFEIEINSTKYATSYLIYIIEYIKGKRKSSAEVQKLFEYMINWMIYKKYSSCEYETLDDLIKDYVEYLI